MIGRRGKCSRKPDRRTQINTPPALYNTIVCKKKRLESTNGTSNRNEYGEVEPEWEREWEQLAAVHPTTGTEMIRGGQVFGTVNWTVRFHANADTLKIDSKDILEFVDKANVTRTVEVLSSVDVENANVEVEVSCREVT